MDRDPLLVELRSLLVACDFRAVLARTGELGPEPAGGTDRARWRELTYVRAVAQISVADYTAAEHTCAQVLRSAEGDGDSAARIQVLGPAITAAYFLGHTDQALSGLDEVLAAAEALPAGQSRVSTFVAAAGAAGTIGLTELSDQLMQQVMAQVDAAPEGTVRPGMMIFLHGMLTTRRCQLAMDYERRGWVRADELYRSVIDLCRQGGSGVVEESATPGVVLRRRAAHYLSHLCFAKIAVGESDDVRSTVDAVLPADDVEPSDMLGVTAEILWGLCRLRLDEPEPGLAARLYDLAHRTQLLPLQAETAHARLRVAERTGDAVLAAALRERCEAVLDELDWRARLQQVHFSGFRSRTLQRLAHEAAGRSRRGEHL